MVQMMTAEALSSEVLLPLEPRGTRGSKGKLILVYGAFGTARWALLLLEKPLASGRPVMVLDEGNSFDPYLITKMARLRGYEPRRFLRQIRISRAFTCHQMVALLKGAEEAAARFKARHILIPGLLSTFYDEDVPEWEAVKLFGEALVALNALMRSGVTVLTVCHEPLRLTRQTFLRALRSRADHVVRIEGEGRPRIYLEKPRSGHTVRSGGGSEYHGQDSSIFSSGNPKDRSGGVELIPQGAQKRGPGAFR